MLLSIEKSYPLTARDLGLNRITAHRLTRCAESHKPVFVHPTGLTCANDAVFVNVKISKLFASLQIKKLWSAGGTRLKICDESRRS